MGIKRHKPEEIVAKLRQVDVLTAQGKSIAEAVKTISVTETTYFRWGGGVWRSEERPGEGFGTGEYAAPASGVGPHLGQADPDGGRPGKLLSPARRRACVDRIKAELRVSERRACAVLRQPRSAQARPRPR